MTGTNVLYTAYRAARLNGDISWTRDTIKLVLVTAGYVFNIAHTSLANVPSAARLSTTAALTTKTTTGGVAGAAFTAFPSVSGAEATAFICYKDTGTESTSTLISYEPNADTLPITPNNNTITVQIPDEGLFSG